MEWFKAHASRVFRIELMHLSVLLVLPVLLAQSLRSPDGLYLDPDIWWHLANARYLFSTHHFIRTEPYAYTVAGQSWANPEWLAEVPFWLAHAHFGALGLYLLTLLLVFTNVALVYLRSREQASPEAAFWASSSAVLLFTVNTGPRTILCAYILLSLLCWAIERCEAMRSKAICWVPLIFLIWTNTHGSWLIGIFLLAVYLICGWFTVQRGSIVPSRRSQTDQMRLCWILLGSVAVLFLNPYGWRLVWNPFDMMFQQKLNIATIEEWRPLDLGTFVGKDVTLIIVMMLAAAVLKGREWKLYELLWVCFAWYAAFAHMRFAFLAGVIVTPYLARDLSALVPARSSHREWPLLNAAFALGCLCLLLRFTPSRERAQQAELQSFPDTLIRLQQPGWRLLNQYELGGRLAYRGHKDFVDSRVDIFEHQGVFADYLDVLNVKRPLEVLDKYKIDHILFEQATPFVYVLEHAGGWHIVQREAKWVLLERSGQKK